ncbi:MAG: ABC transporter ATP-binding protein [Firmicutes bacterium]|nr:ABC transporter ATP-binding protein [Bacillota bacterium]
MSERSEQLLPESRSLAPVDDPGAGSSFGSPASASEYVLEARSLTRSFGRKVALSGLDLQLAPGHIVGLLGPNASGKTTLMKLACGLLQPTAGQILVDGRRPGPATRSMVAYLPDTSFLNDNMRVRDVVAMYADFFQDFDREAAAALIRDLRVEEGARLSTLSKGTREKVQLVLVMSRRARLYLLDEPIGGVDPAAREYIINTIIGNYHPEATVLISTHLIYDVEPVLDHALFLKDGRIVMEGGVDELRETSGRSLDGLFREVFRC